MSAKVNIFSRYKFFIIAIIVILVAIIGLQFYSTESNKKVYNRETTRATIDLNNTEFVQNLKNGKSSINEYLGGYWYPLPIEPKEEHKDFLIEKMLFLRTDEAPDRYTELVVFDTYSKEAFPNVSSYLKRHAQELKKQNPKGRIKILHDGTKGIIYQWAIKGEDGKTAYLEFGKVEMTTDGVLSIKYINKGTANLEVQRQKAIKLFTKM